ncbi:glycosyltransferase [Nocardia caishijiensis]|uniref:UDP:flavonoid glycosyltransferase YjiC (YdhE family) n=1 Tax=Nocardia caishijiensis TaxID=184756 RepID=A0ABQ6YHH2_9NOCA|nr:nucleotide disphospho-sugar-binding domain-containing protein [Nocardia caishijiensis]KAF0845237.1 UDP:flavonoid glycosyltransferase YjiC (YdhE family) [Nocardia caishijiensis]
MRFLLAFNGTRGDIQPAVVVGSELQRRGHDVLVGAPPNLGEFVAAAGLATAPFGYDTHAHMNSDVVRAKLRTGGPRQRWRAFAEIRDLGWAQAVGDMRELHKGAEAILTGFVTEQIAAPFAEAAGAACISLHHAPIRPNSTVSPVPAALSGVPPVVTRASWWLTDTAMWLLTRDRQNTLRADLGIAGEVARSPRDRLEIQAYDPRLCPELVDEWSPSRPFVGFLDLAADQRARIGADTGDPDLPAWIAAGSAPVYFGFGSMPVPDPGAVVDAIVRASARLGVRALISTGWAGLTVPESPDVRLVGALDHQRILPLCRAAVHHGGAGTTAAVLRAGIPALVCWVGSDQPYWGDRCVHHGVGATTRLRGLTADTLVRELTTVLAPEPARAAKALGAELITPEQAVRHCADLVEEYTMASRPAGGVR